MTTKEFVAWALKTQGLTKYKLAKSLGLAPVSINQYQRGTKMSEATAAEVKKVYGVTITDAFVR